MVNYRRNLLAGGTYFFTVTLQDRRSSLLVDHIDLLRESFRKIRKERPFRVDAIVVLPDHLHALWTLPPDDSDYPARWRAVKSSFTRSIVEAGAPATKNDRGEFDVWQRRYWEHTIRDDLDLQRHVDYIHYNLVKHGLAMRAVNWPHSSFHRYVALGLLAADWAATDSGNKEFGE